ncbi:MAG: hypothetical protein ABSE22_13265 [Xanthobacteraceae bacterium]|jgi:hypothetical protein
MAEHVQGCHHCIGASFTITDLLFNFIETHAKENNGLSLEDVAGLRVRFLDSFSHGYDYFETIHRKCMTAGNSTRTAPLSRDTILQSLLTVCAKRAAESAFKSELAACGPAWLNDFFAGFAKYISDQVDPDAEAQLVKIFVHSAGKHKSSLTIERLMHDPKTQAVLERCLKAFHDKSKAGAKSDSISVAVNDHISKRRNIVGANVAKTTMDDMRVFLEMLPKEAGLAIKAHQLVTISRI